MTTMTVIIIIVIIIIVVVIVERSQEVLEGPASHLFALLSCRFVRKAEVDALVDPTVYHFLPRIRESSERTGVLDGWAYIGGRD